MKSSGILAHFFWSFPFLSRNGFSAAIPKMWIAVGAPLTVMCYPWKKLQSNYNYRWPWSIDVSVPYHDSRRPDRSGFAICRNWHLQGHWTCGKRQEMLSRQRFNFQHKQRYKNSPFNLKKAHEVVLQGLPGKSLLGFCGHKSVGWQYWTWGQERRPRSRLVVTWCHHRIIVSSSVSRVLRFGASRQWRRAGRPLWVQSSTGHSKPKSWMMRALPLGSAPPQLHWLHCATGCRSAAPQVYSLQHFLLSSFPDQEHLSHPCF